MQAQNAIHVQYTVCECVQHNSDILSHSMYSTKLPTVQYL